MTCSPLQVTGQKLTGSFPEARFGVFRPHPYQRRHINIHGHYTVAFPDLGGTHRALRDPDHSDGAGADQLRAGGDRATPRALTDPA